MNRTPAAQARTAPPNRSDAAVAERFRYFLSAAGMTREELVQGVDGAISAKSLFSVLNGSRRPSRALAVLIERTWGFRASFLLHGEGPMWAARGTGGRGNARAGRSPQEAAVIAFMRRSVENARTMERELARAQLWERLFARTMALIEELEACGASDDAGDRAVYPLFVKLVYEECQFAAERHARLGALQVRHRVHRLTDRFLTRYIDELPRRMLTAHQHEALVRTLRPVLARRAKSLRALDASSAALTTTLENLVDLGSPRALLEETARTRREAGGTLTEELTRIFASIPPRALQAPLRRQLTAVLEEAARAAPARPSLSDSLQRLARDLLAALEVEVPVDAQSVEELRALHHATVAPLTA